MKNFLLTALLGLLVLNPIQHVVAPDTFTPQQCKELRKMAERHSMIRSAPDFSTSSRLVNLILKKCDELEDELIKNYVSKGILVEHKKITQGTSPISPAVEVYKSHQLMKEIMTGIQTREPIGAIAKIMVRRRVDVGFVEGVIKWAPDALLTLEECSRVRSNLLNEQQHDERYGREKNFEICNNMIALFRTEIANALTLVEQSKSNWAGKRAELEFIKTRVFELAMLGAGLDEATKQRVEKATR